MKIRNFSPMDLPIQWREYYTKYPHGMTIFESLVQWVNTVNDMVENINDLNHYMNDFINQWQGEMKEEVINTLTEWKESGFLENILITVFGDALEDMDLRIDEVEDKIATTVDYIDDSIIKLKEDSNYYGVDYTRKFDEVSKTHYYLTFLPSLDEKGERVRLRHEFIGPRRIAIPQFAEENTTTVAFNGGMYDSSNNINIDYNCIVDGEIIRDRPPTSNRRYTLGIREDHTLKAYPPNVSVHDMLADGVVDAFVGFIPMIEGGSTRTDLIDIHESFEEPHPRQVIIQLNNKDLVLLTTGGRGIEGEGFTSNDIIRVINSNLSGVQFAYMLDGGGSVQTVIRGTMINSTVERVNGIYGGGMRYRPNVLYMKKENPQPTATDITLRNMANEVGRIKRMVDSLTGVQMGTWKPGLIDSTDNEPAGIEYQTQEGHYTRVGNLIVAYFHIKLSNRGSGNGAMRIYPLPAPVGQYFSSFPVSIFTNMASMNNLCVTLAKGDWFGRLRRVDDNMARVNIQHANLTNTTELIGTIVYSVDPRFEGFNDLRGY